MSWPYGRILKVQPRFQVLRFAPGPKSSLWAYCSVGAWEVGGPGVRRLEFLYLSAAATDRMVELLAMLTAYHQGNKLDYRAYAAARRTVGPRINTRSPVDFYALYSGSRLRELPPRWAHAHCVWALPITAAQRAFKVEHGLEALEQRFEDAGLEYWNPGRASVV